MFKVGDTVRCIDQIGRIDEPEFFPLVGTTGIVQRVDDNGDLWVQWPAGTTSLDDLWCVHPASVAPVAIEGAICRSRPMAITPITPYNPSCQPRKSLDKRHMIYSAIGWIILAAFSAYIFGSILIGLYRVV